MQTETIAQGDYHNISVSIDEDSITITQENYNASDDTIILNFPSALKLAAALNRLVPAEHNEIYNHKDMD